MPSPRPAEPARVRAELDPARVEAFQRRILTWYEGNRRDLPWRRTRDPYAILVSEVMLQQTQVQRVVPRFEAWLATYPTLDALAEAPLADVLRRWSGLGYNNRARRLRDCARAAVAAAAAAGAAALPRELGGLLELPGIGPYTARAVLIFAHNDDLAAVDANVRRVLIRELDLRQDLSDGRLQEIAEHVLPRGRSRDWHNALMDYGTLRLTSRATGIGPRTSQGSFEGSRRQRRARILRLLLERPHPLAEIAARLDLDETHAADLVEALRRDGLVRISRDLVAIA